MFIRPEEILMELTRTYKTKSFGLSDVIEWCMQVETDHICDVDVMNKYVVDLRVHKGRVTLPINIYRILVITDQSGNVIKHKTIGGLYIHGLDKYEGEYIRIEFLGVVMDYDCIPLIAASHKDACKRYIIIQLFEDEALSDVNMYKMQQNRWAEFAGIVIKTKQGFREWTMDAIASLSTHRYNEPFKDLYYRLAERSRERKVYNMPSNAQKRGENEELDIMDIKTLMDQYVDLINETVRNLPHTKSITFILGTDGVFQSNIWTITLLSSMGIDTFSMCSVTVYKNGALMIIPVTCTATTIVIDLSNAQYDPTATYTAAVVPPTNI